MQKSDNVMHNYDNYAKKMHSDAQFCTLLHTQWFFAQTLKKASFLVMGEFWCNLGVDLKWECLWRNQQKISLHWEHSFAKGLKIGVKYAPYTIAMKSAYWYPNWHRALGIKEGSGNETLFVWNKIWLKTLNKLRHGAYTRIFITLKRLKM